MHPTIKSITEKSIQSNTRSRKLNPSQSVHLRQLHFQDFNTLLQKKMPKNIMTVYHGRPALNKIKATTKTNKSKKIGTLSKPKRFLARKSDGTFERLKEIMKSKQYQELNEKYISLKIAELEKKDQLYNSIKLASMKAQMELKQLRRLKNMRDQIQRQITSMKEVYEDVCLQNYELKCELCQQYNRDYVQYLGYDSLMNFEEMEYEDLLELEERIGNEEVGLSLEEFKKLPLRNYEKTSQNEKCIICYQDLNEGEVITLLNCTHFHHNQCLSKWLKLKNWCPLCKQKVVAS